MTRAMRSCILENALRQLVHRDAPPAPAPAAAPAAAAESSSAAGFGAALRNERKGTQRRDSRQLSIHVESPRRSPAAATLAAGSPRSLQILDSEASKSVRLHHHRTQSGVICSNSHISSHVSSNSDLGSPVRAAPRGGSKSSRQFRIHPSPPGGADVAPPMVMYPHTAPAAAWAAAAAAAGGGSGSPVKGGGSPADSHSHISRGSPQYNHILPESNQIRQCGQDSPRYGSGAAARSVVAPLPPPSPASASSPRGVLRRSPHGPASGRISPGSSSFVTSSSISRSKSMYASKSPPISVVPKCQEEDSNDAAWGPRFGGSRRSVLSPASEPGWSRRFASVDLDEWGAATYAPWSSHELTDPFDASYACDANGTAWDNNWECDSVATDTSTHGQAAEDIAIYRSSSTGHRYPVVMTSSSIGSSGQRACQWDDPCSPAAAAAQHAPHSASSTPRHGSGASLDVPHAAPLRDDRHGASLPPPARQGSGSARKQQLPTHKRSHSAAPHSAALHSHPSHPGHGSLTRYLPHLEIPGKTGQLGQTVSLSAKGHRKTHSHSAALHGNTTHPGQLGQLSHTTHPGRLTPLDLPGQTRQATTDDDLSDSDDDFIGLYAAVVRSRAGAGSMKARAGGMNVGAGTGSTKA
ncbi:unnamed protein product [Closterium sp. NIES-54]